MPEVELGPVWLSLQLATVTVLVLLLVATPLAWWLAFTRSRARTVVEAVVAMPLVLPPTVLGFYLLVLLGPAGPIGSAWVSLTDTTLTFSFAGLVVASAIYSFPFAVQPLQAAFEGVGPRAARSGGDARRRPARSVLARRIPARAARLRVRGRADVRAHARRVRRRADGRRQHSGPHEGHLDRDLRARRDDRLCASARARGRAARVLVRRAASPCTR